MSSARDLPIVDALALAGCAVAAILIERAYDAAHLSVGVLAFALGLVVRAFTYRRKAPTAHLSRTASAALKTGVALLGLKIGAEATGSLYGLPLAAGVVAAGLVAAAAFGRLAGVDVAGRWMVGGAGGVCGAAAAAACGSAVGASPARISQVILHVTLAGFALTGILAMAVAQGWVTPRFGAAWAGLGLPEVAQVALAGDLISPAQPDAAMTLKVSRILLLGMVVVLASIRPRAEGARGSASILRLIPPWYVLLFLGLALLASAVPLPVSIGRLIDMAFAFAMGVALAACAMTIRRSDLSREAGALAATTWCACGAAFAAAFPLAKIAVQFS